MAKHSLPRLEKILADQENLPALCADRPLFTDEIFGPNAYYGMDRVLKVYAGVPSHKPLKFALTHGIQINEHYVWDAEIASPVPLVLYFPSRLGRAYAAHKGKIALQTATPFLYVSDLLAEQLRPVRKGTLFFPAHSTHWITAISEFDVLAERLAELPDKFHPISVCMYWRDFLLGHHVAFARRGMRIVSAGHIYDPDFLVRLHHLCSMHKYSCSNELGSQLFFSVKAGCSYFHLPGNARYYDGGSDTAMNGLPVASEDRGSHFEAIFSEPKEHISDEQLALVDDYVGAAHKLSPEGMREFLQFCEKLDRFGNGVWRGKRYRTYPRVFQRWLWQKPNRILRGVARPLLQRGSCRGESEVSS